ncbi:hypothetical protein BACCAP_00206 [Pseudoflavonifractor capillosus ATCC 29799]|uniref:Uncharacterized protein n=1 Tax=Pseudoflavonifractor capillosus ATCC 29799 TaxID=411467 RepID=A6NPU0_9FIRM|nr:hypothetical protein BACCAP_00206 [Pseudoflavonifractor capillosus ATCC 29799]
MFLEYCGFRFRARRPLCPLLFVHLCSFVFNCPEKYVVLSICWILSLKRGQKIALVL